jgi:hypothetical protein
MRSTIYVSPFSLVKFSLHFRGNYCLDLQGQRVSLANKFLLARLLKLEAVRSSETLVDFFQSVLHHILKDCVLHLSPANNLCSQNSHNATSTGCTVTRWLHYKVRKEFLLFP